MQQDLQNANNTAACGSQNVFAKLHSHMDYLPKIKCLVVFVVHKDYPDVIVLCRLFQYSKKDFKNWKQVRKQKKSCAEMVGAQQHFDDRKYLRSSWRELKTGISKRYDERGAKLWVNVMKKDCSQMETVRGTGARDRNRTGTTLRVAGFSYYSQLPEPTTKGCCSLGYTFTISNDWLRWLPSSLYTFRNNFGLARYCPP